MAVTSQHAKYVKMLPKWQRCEDVSDGTDAVHEGGEVYLPKLKDQSQEDYAKFVARTPFFNATWRTIAGLLGMVFSKSPVIEVPPAVTPMLDDITMEGESFYAFLQDVTEEALKKGRVGILVDYPQGDTVGMSVAQAEQLGLRPMMKKYNAETIYNWRTGRVNNQTVLTEVRLMETHCEQVGEWETSEESRYRVLDLTPEGYRVRVYKVDDKGNEVQIGSDLFPLMNGKPLPYIPFQFIGTDDLTPDIDDPPLIDLVDMNVHHYRTSAIKANALPFAVPTMFIAGQLNLEVGEKVYVGSSKAIHSTDPSSHAEYIEFSGQGLGAVEKEIDKTEQQMAILGARMLEPQRTAVESAEGQSIHRKGEESILATVAKTISDGMTVCLKWFSDWAGAGDSVTLELNTDFYPQGMTPQMLTAVMGAWQQGMPGFSDQNVYAMMQRGKIADPETTFEEADAQTSVKAPMLAAPEPQGQMVTGEAMQQPDLQPLIDAINALIAKPVEPPVVNVAAPVVNIPAPVINMPEQPAPVINITQPDISITQSPITVNVPEQQAPVVTVNNVEGKKTIGVERDAQGNIIGATVQ